MLNVLFLQSLDNMRQKKLLLLGGIRYLLPVIKAAHSLGYYVITADNVPDNIAHKFSDEYVNVSIIDKETVLEVAKEKAIDGIMSFGVDPGVVAAAYVAEEMGLPSPGPYKSVEILQNKNLFRRFLKDNGFNVPWAESFSSIDDALSYEFSYPVIVKPTDSAGSKGVSRVDSPEKLASALENAFSHSIKRKVIVEAFIEKEGCSSDTDCFSVDGELRFVSFSSQRFDELAANPYTPAAYTWPSSFTLAQEEYLTSELQRLISLLGMRTSIYNVETRIGKDGKPYIMEVSPRGGGNRLAEMIRYATGVDLISASVQAALGEPFDPIQQQPYDGLWAEVILHAEKGGSFRGVKIKDSISQYLVEKDVWAKKGDMIRGFEGANDAIGTLIMKFDTIDTMHKIIGHQKDWLRILI